MSFLGIMSQEGKVQPFDRSRPFNGEFFADALLFFKALYFVTPGATILLDQRVAFALHIWIIHERRVRIRRWSGEREQVGGYVPGISVTEPEVRHHGHTLNLQLGAVVRTA